MHRQRLCSALGAVVFAALPPVASAYTYQGPSTPVASCDGATSCLLASSGFAAVTLRGGFSTEGETLVTFAPTQPAARGGTTLKAVRLSVAMSRGRLYLYATREYDNGGRSYLNTYPVTDPLGVGLDMKLAPSLDLTVYMSQSQAWIESRGPTDLATVWTTPLFFGYGPETAGTVSVTVASDAPAERSYATVDSAALIQDVNANYAKRSDITPFLFQGDAAEAAALLAAIEGGRR